MKNFWETMKPAVVMVAVQIVFSACNVIYKLAINDGMSTIVISAYRMAFAAATTIPIALIFERKRPKMSWRVIFMTFLSGTFGGTLFQNLFYGALVLASATLVSAIYNLIPSITFILAVFCGFEKLNWGRVSGKAKVVGTLLGLAGALLLTFYKGVEFDIWPFSINLLDPHKNQTYANVAADTSRELLGVLCVVISCFSFSLWLIIQRNCIFCGTWGGFFHDFWRWVFHRVRGKWKGGSISFAPIVLVSFLHVRGNVVLQNVMNATKVLWNPEIPEVASFRAGLSLHGIDPRMPLGDIDDGFRRIPMDDEFLKLFPRKTLHELHSTEEEGMFIVLAKITGLVDGEKWWYSSCQCHKSVTVEDGMFRCNSCSTIVLEVIPRFRIKVEVSDLNESAIFVLFDFEGQHLLQSSCKQLVVSSKDLPVDEYPDAIKEIVGKEFLFKVEKSADHGVKYDDSFKVKKICDVSFVIEAFKNLRSVQTPKKSMTGSFISKFSSGSTNGAMSEESGGSSGNLSEIGPSPVSLDDISTGEDSCVVTSGGSAGIVDTDLSKPAKRMRLRNNKADNI